MSIGPELPIHRPRRLTQLGERVVRTSEFLVVSAAALLVIATVITATVTLYSLFINGLHTKLSSIESIDALQEAIQHIFAGVLLLMLGLELLETLKTYFQHYQIRTEVILVVAMIAVGRHIIQFDYEHTSGAMLLGTAALMLALSISYYLVRTRGRTPLEKKMNRQRPAGRRDESGEDTKAA